MFSYSPAHDCVPLGIESVLELHVSVNRPAIAAEGLDAQEAQAFFISGHGARGIEAFIYLKMLTSDRALLYPWRGVIEKNDYPEIRESAIQFAESMGFMMEDMQFRRLSMPEKETLAAEYGVFAPLRRSAPAAAPQAEPVVALEPAPAADRIEDSILDLSLDAPSTQVGYERESPAPEAAGGESPLEDKNFKVFLRLLTSA